MRFTLTTITHLLLTSLTTASAIPAPGDQAASINDIAKRQCGTVNGRCDDAQCNGFNTPSNGLGYCRGGPWNGCPCTSVCGSYVGSCFDNGCDGRNGSCQGGRFAGCPCR